MKQQLNNLNELIGKIETFFVSILLSVMIVLAFLQVVMRNVFNEGIPWADSVVRLMVLWVGLFGGCLATKLEQNITIEVMTKYMPERGKHLVGVLVKSFAVIVCLYLFKASLTFIQNESSSGSEFLHLFPDWWTVTIIPIAFILIPFHLSFSIVKDAQYFLKGKKS
ncbi:MAG: TRAP transporter small permease subunit [Deltaproteobacteria bacterium]|nr:MAG: TRAP transporter small permease subunit [Deltaproteobacteria bacterium]